jgi:membrane protease subunit HflK
MNDEHEHGNHEHAPGPSASAPAPLTPDDAGSQALAEALRSSFAIVKFVMLLLIVLFFVSGLFQVGPQEKAVILRFGRPVGEGQKALLGSGLHWSFPYPIDEVVKIPIREIQSVSSSVGWYYMSAQDIIEYKTTGVPPQGFGNSLDPAMDGYAITADRNIIHTRATLYYQVDDPIRYVFGFSSASNMVQNALDNALLHTAAHFGVDNMLYSDVAGFQDAVEQTVSQLADQEQLGITIKQCNVESVAPRQLKNVFDQVTEARENRTKVLDDAHSFENQITNSADAQASAIISEAISARARYVQSLKADAKAFSDLLPKYELNPSLFVRQKVVQVVGETLTNVEFKSYLPTTAGGYPTELRLMLNREPPGPKPAGP